MDSEKQKDEITALESIYNKEEFSYHKEDKFYECTFKIFLNLPTGYYITYCDGRYPKDPVKKVQISHLPPLSLYVTLPENYPSTLPPKFVLGSSCLNQYMLTALCRRLDKLWKENKGQEILFIWIGFLEDETLSFLDIETCLSMKYIYTIYKIALEEAQSPQKYKEEHDLKQLSNIEDTKHTITKHTANICSKNELQRECFKEQADRSMLKQAILECPFGKNPIQFLIDYNEKRNQIEFNKSLYTCKICFMDKLGEHCTKFLPCSHVFCKDCISGYLEVKIKDGSVQNISCPEEKCTSEATPGQVKDLVTPEMFVKYDSILLNATLDTMTDIVYCPRRHCQYPVSRDLNEQMASCPVCHYTFCVYCKMVYHGIEPCKINSVEKQQLVNEYQAASDDKKLQMEQRYGKKQLQNLVENTMSENWINTNSHHCPQCKAAIEKSDGCNKMTCWKCKTFFCWLCGGILHPITPYLHFRNPNSRCFNMLYYGSIPNEDEDDDEDDVGFPAIYHDYDPEDNNPDFYDHFVFEYDY